MEFNNIRNIDALLDDVDKKDKFANAVTDVYVQYLTDVVSSSKTLLGIHHDFMNYYNDVVLPAREITPDVKQKIDLNVSSYLKQYSDKINSTLGGVQKIIDFIEPALKGTKFAPVIEESVEGAGLQSKPAPVEGVEEEGVVEEHPLKYKTV
jgi:hypothetical protein